MNKVPNVYKSKYSSLTECDAVSSGELYRVRKNSILKFREVIGG